MHVAVDVREEGLVSGAQVVEPGLTIGREYEAVLRALAIAGEADIAVDALPGQRVAFGVAERALLW